MTKSRRNAIMRRSKVKNRFNETRTETNWSKCKKQRNCCVSLFGETKRDYFSNLNIRNVSNNKMFRRTVKPFFTVKGLNSNSNKLTEKSKKNTNEYL